MEDVPVMISQSQYRILALALPEAVESSHFDVIDFRVRKKIFATLREADGRAVVKLTPDQQALLGETNPGILAPVPGGWGSKGWTQLELAAASEEEARHLLAVAWRNVAPKKLRDAFP
jgi:hypothetical protein